MNDPFMIGAICVAAFLFLFVLILIFQPSAEPKHGWILLFIVFLLFSTAIIFAEDIFGGGSYLPGYGASPEACDTSQNYGTDTYFDDIRITGSREFVSATVDALQRLWYTPSYRRYVKALHAIREDYRGGHICKSPRDCAAWTRHDGVMWAWPSTIRYSCNYYAQTITHEGAHNVGIDHGPGMTAVEHAVLRELKSSTQVAERR